MAAKSVEDTVKDQVKQWEPAMRAGAAGALTAFRAMLDVAVSVRQMAEGKAPVPKDTRDLLLRTELDFLREIERVVKSRIEQLESKGIEGEPKKIEVKVRKKAR